MRYKVTFNPRCGGAFWFHNALGESHFITEQGIELTAAQLGVEGLTAKRLICTPISDSGKPLVEAQPAPDGNPAFDVTQSAEVAEPTPDFDSTPTETFTRPATKRRKRR
jgi:hypothetical protein